MNFHTLSDPAVCYTAPPPPPRPGREIETTLTPEVCPDPVQFARETLDFDLDPKQAEILTGRRHRLMLNCTRQFGKSTVTAIKAVHVAMSNPGALVLIAAPVGRQSAEFIDKAQQFVIKLGIKPRGDGKNPISIRFPNGARIVGIPGKCDDNVVGFSKVSLLIFDEAARVTDELYKALTPMLAVSNGALWLLSTPKYTTGFFYHEWKFGEGWDRISVRATECPRISPEFLERERASMGERHFRREFMCEFHDLGGALFMRELLERCFTSEVSRLPLATSDSPLTGHWPQATGHYFVGIDLGQKCDFTAISVLQRIDPPPAHFLAPWATQPTLYHLRYLERLALGTPYPKIVQHIVKLSNDPILRNRCTLVVDGTGVGAPIVDELKRSTLGGDLVSVTITGGEHANRSGHGWSVPRRDLLGALMIAVENEQLKIAADLPERRCLVEELMAMHAGPGRGRSAEHDDMVFSIALAAWRANVGTVGHQNSGRLL